MRRTRRRSVTRFGDPGPQLAAVEIDDVTPWHGHEVVWPSAEAHPQPAGSTDDIRNFGFREPGRARRRRAAAHLVHAPERSPVAIDHWQAAQVSELSHYPVAARATGPPCDPVCRGREIPPSISI